MEGSSATPPEERGRRLPISVDEKGSHGGCLNFQPRFKLRRKCTRRAPGGSGRQGLPRGCALSQLRLCGRGPQGAESPGLGGPCGSGRARRGARSLGGSWASAVLGGPRDTWRSSRHVAALGARGPTARARTQAKLGRGASREETWCAGGPRALIRHLRRAQNRGREFKR